MAEILRFDRKITIDDLSFLKGRKVISFRGYSGPYEEPEVLDILLRTTLESLDPQKEVISGGCTLMGIGRVYTLARDKGFTTMGLMMEKYSNQLNLHLDYAIIFDEPINLSGGPDTYCSQSMVEISTQAFFFGGGKISEQEIEMFRDSKPEALNVVYMNRASLII